MHEGVSDILVARAREFDGVSRPITASFAVHATVLIALAVLPSAWFSAKPAEKPMIITLGAGAVGPDPNGLTGLGARRVEEVTPPKAREPIVPVAPPKSTALVEPIKAPAKTPPPPTKPVAATSAPAAKPATGAKITQGTAVAATTATGLGVGLSSGGQGGTALDSNWCCPDWTNLMLTRINWNEHQGLTGTVIIQFVVEKDGKITNIQYQQRSGIASLDLDAQRALDYAQLPPLPAAYTGNRLTVTLTFPYNK